MIDRVKYINRITSKAIEFEVENCKEAVAAEDQINYVTLQLQF